MTFVIAHRLAYNDSIMMATVASDRRALKAKVRAVQRLLIKAYGEPPRPAWAGTVRVDPVRAPDRAEATTQWEPIDPLDELINTILSQNTNDLNRDRAYHALRAKFPTWEEVRDAPTGQVITAIKSAGLANQKGPRIQQVLRRITAERGELDLNFLRDLPTDEAKAWLTSLDGVGPKTASIVLLFALGKPAFPVDTHIHRVTGRLGLIPPKTSADKAHDILAELVPPEWYHSFHLNVIEHGRRVCKAQRPLCAKCVLQKYCDYFRNRPV
ncbi:MAG TPA: endonuclease III [Anaerolineae bacterium]|nr:endonuclease III [Anaerolineae bacterium]